MTAEERTKAKLIKVVGNNIVNKNWHWQGTQYSSFGWCGTCGIEAYVRFTANFRSIEAEVTPDIKYNVASSVEKFEGDEAMTAAVEWTADKLYELYKTVTERTAPFQQGYNNYVLAMQGYKRG